MSDRNAKAIFTKILFGSVMLISALAMVVTGSGDLFKSPKNQTIATIGDTKISGPEFTGIYSRALEQNNLPDAMARQMGVASMVLQREIERRVLLQAAEKSGIRISDRYVASQLRQQLDQVAIPGTPQEKLKMILNQQKITESELVELLRGDFAANVLASAATSGDIKVPEPLILSNYRAEREKRSAQLVPVNAANAGKSPALTDARMQAYFNENRENYRQPETRDLEILVLPQSLFASETAITSQEMQAYYDQQKSRFMSPERVRLEQIVLTDEAEARKIAAAKPASLEAFKNDKVQYLKTDWYTKDTLPKDFQASLFPAKPKGILAPVKTALGWHVLNVDSYEDATQLGFEQARPDIERNLKEERLETQMTEFTDEIDALIAEQVSLATIAERYKLKPAAISAMQKGDATKQLKDLPTPVQQRAQEAAFTLEADETSPLLDTSDGNFILVRVTKINPSIIPEIKQVQDRVRTDAAKDLQAKSLTDLSEKLIGVYDVKNPKAFETALQSGRLAVTQIGPATKAEIEKIHGKDIAGLLFALTPENALSYTQTADTVNLIRLLKIEPSTETPDKKAQDAAAETVKNDMVQELQQQFSQAWQQQIGVNVNSSALQAFGPQSAQPQDPQ